MSVAVVPVGVQHLARMPFESYHGSFHAVPSGLVAHLINKVLVPQVYAVEEPDRRHTGLIADRAYNGVLLPQVYVYCLHSGAKLVQIIQK